VIPIGSYDYSRLVKSYFVQDRSKASTAGGRMSYHGTTLYSYDSKLAELDLANNVLLIDSDITDYSKTTRDHARGLQAYKPIGMQVFYTLLSRSTVDNLQEYWNRINVLLDELPRARKPHTRKHKFDTIVSLYETALKYEI